MNIFELNRGIEELIDPETGEIRDYEAFEQLQMERDEKIGKTAGWYKLLLAQAKAVKEEEGKLAERRAGLERKAERLGSYLERALEGRKFSSECCEISFRRTPPSFFCEDEAKLLELLQEQERYELLSFRQPTLDRAQLKAAMKRGERFEGCSLVSRLSMSVR